MGPDAFGNRALSRAGLEEAGRRVAARFAAPEAALRRAQALIGPEHAGAAMTAESTRLLSEQGVAPEPGGAQRSEERDPRRDFQRLARARIAALPAGRREGVALHAGREAQRLEVGLRRRAQETGVRALQGEVDAGLAALTEALTVPAGGAVESLVPDRAVRAGLRLELESALAQEDRVARAATAALEALHLERLGRGEAGLPDLEGDIRAERGDAAARALVAASAAARRRHLLELRYRLAPLSEIEAALAAETPDGPQGAPREAPQGGQDPSDTTRRALLEEVTGEILAARRRDPAAAVADHPSLKAVEEDVPEGPGRRAVLASMRLELAALTGAIEATPGGARVALLKGLKERYGRHYGRLTDELRRARLDPVTLAMAERLDDPLALRRLERLPGRPRADLTEGLEGEIERRAPVVGIVPNGPAITRPPVTVRRSRLLHHSSGRDRNFFRNFIA